MNYNFFFRFVKKVKVGLNILGIVKKKSENDCFDLCIYFVNVYLLSNFIGIICIINIFLFNDVYLLYVVIFL